MISNTARFYSTANKAGECYWTEGMDGWRFGRRLAYQNQNRAAEMAVSKEILAGIWKF
jgi:hypothetical protein